MYKKKKIALVFFARSNSRRLKNKLFKKILNKTILSHAIDLTKNLKIVDEMIMATTTNKIDEKIVKLSKQKNISFYRGSENNVLERMYFAIKSLKNRPDVIIRFCCENLFYSTKIIEKYVKKMINEKLDLMSVIKPSNLFFGAAPIIISFNALEKIYKKAKNDVHKEHVETYCYDNKNFFNIYYIKDKKDYYFPDTGLSIDNIEEFKRVKKIFETLKIKNYHYDFKNIIKKFSKKKIFIKDTILKKYLKKNYKNFYYSSNTKNADIVIGEKTNSYKNDNKLYLKITKVKNKILLSFIKNSKIFDLIKIKKINNLQDEIYIKLFFETLIKKSFFWPPLPIDDLDTNFKFTKVTNKKKYYKKDEYFPREIISNKKIYIKKKFIKNKVVENNKIKKMIKFEKTKNIREKMFVYNNHFVYMPGNKLIKIKKFDYLKIVSVWRSYQYTV